MDRKHTLLRPLGLLSVFAALATISCANGGIEPTRDQGVNATVESLRPSVSDEVALNLLIQTLIGDCMADAGFEYALPDPAVLSAAIAYRNNSEALNGRPTQAVPVDSAVPPPAEVDPNESILAALSESERARYLLVLLGDPSDVVQFAGFDGSLISSNRTGCYAEARIAVFGSVETATYGELMVGNLQSTAAGEAIIDPKVLSDTALWSDCMAASGYDYDSFLDAGPARSNMAEDQAKRQFDADVRCSEESGLSVSFAQAFQGVVNRLVEANSEALNTYLRLRTEAIARATTP